MGKHGGPPPKIIDDNEDDEESKQRCYMSMREFYALQAHDQSNGRYNDHTFFDDCGFPVYRRRKINRTVLKSKQHLDNQFVVPYNRDLLLQFQCHMNLEGHDNATMLIRRKKGNATAARTPQNIDEIRHYLDERYVYASEAAWRILGFDIHYQYPSVERLPVHDEGRKNVIFNITDNIEEIASKASNRKSATSFKDLRTVDRRVYVTYKEVCNVLGLLKDDNQWHYALKENAESSMPQQLRSMFVFILNNCPVADPAKLWSENWKPLSEDILYLIRKKSGNQDLNLNDVDLENYALTEVEKLLNGIGKYLKNYPDMPFPEESYMQYSTNRLIEEETGYDKNLMKEEHDKYFSYLNAEQLEIYNVVLQSIHTGNRCLFLSTVVVDMVKPFFGTRYVIACAVKVK
ncbi:uncharacterized protein LOC141714263 [Apium graveolens]|uniref:uncharacterized protein LOC141714263 n=1 Tax=Apium graveolens TaxID=4045 RepID=UPI003D7AF7E3